MIRNPKSYEDARDSAQFNGMNASIRKGGNQYRDSFSQYGTHQQSGHTLRDGMSYQSLSSLPLGVPTPAAAVAAASAANAPPQTSHYVQGTPLQTSAVASGTAGSLHGLTPHSGITTSTPTVLPLPNQHSQGPTPSSTPPAAPNDPKTSGHYSQQANYPLTMNMNYNYQRAAPAAVYYQPVPGAPRNQHNNRGLQHMAGNRIVVFNPHSSVPYMQQLQMPSAPMTQNNNAIAPLVNHFQPEQYSNYYVPQQNPPASQNFALSYQNYRPASTSNMRSTNQQIPISYSNSGVQGAMMFNPNVSQVSPLPQQPAARPQKKERKKAIKIIDPHTGEELKVDDTNQNSTTNEKDEKNEAKNSAVMQFATEVGRRATEPSSNFTSSTTAPSYTKKEPPLSSVLNGTEKNASSFLPSTDWKSPSQPNSAPSSIQNTSDNANSIDPVVNSLKSSNAASSTLQSTKMDYKRPTREEPLAAATATNDVDVAIKPLTTPVTSWPESTAPQQPAVVVAPATTTAQKPATSAAVTSKKIPKESETTVVSSSPVGSSASSPVPSFTPSNDGLKAPSVTSTSVVLDDNETASKKTPKQGIQSSVVADEDATKQLPPQAAKSTSAATASSQSLPHVSQAPVTTSAPPPAQSNVTKVDAKPIGMQPNPAVLQSQQNVKPSTSALQTSGPVSEKPSPIATPPAPFGQPFPSKTSVPAVSPVSNAAPADKNAVVKDEKTNPSKIKNRGKENAETNVDQSNAKKSAQSVPAKHHSAETAKSGGASAASTATVASKQTNGEAADSQNVGEGKSKKNKKASKKEMINKKGSEKEGSDMDVFTEKPSSPAEKSRSNEKATAQTNNTSANRSSKTNSSQKIIDDKEDISAGEPKKELVNSQNIPATQTVPAAELNKTEQTVTESRPKKYPVEFLLQLRDLPQCKKPVMISSNLQQTLYEDQSNRSANTMNRGPSGYNFMPQFGAPGRGSMSLPARKSQQGRLKNDRPTPIHVSLSLREDVPLRHSKDAWKPARLNPDLRNLSSDEKKTQELYKTVTGILNKLTPEKFETLVERIRSLPIDNVPRLQGVIDLIFDKAIDEPGFCRWYAEMCKVMQTVEIDEKNSKASFRTLLINKCQQQFERDKAEELDVIKKQEEIQACTDLEKKKELQLLFEETERKVRRKSVGNCRFIGELFKLQMLTAKIMLRCVTKLLGSIDEESLECLCKLLTTIGKDLENKVQSGNNSGKRELDQYFDRMQELSENKKYKVSSRIRFMLQDVIDLRRNNWVPRREADNPKKIDQINTELERKEHEIKMMNLQPPRRQDDYYNNRNRDFKKGSRSGSQNEDEWKIVSKNYKQPNYKVDTNKFAGMHASAIHDLTPDSLGPADGFKKWSHGVAAVNKPGEKKNTPYSSFSLEKQPSMTSSNSFRNLSNKVTPSSSMEKPRPYPSRDDEAGKISRSGSAQNIHPSSRESSVPRQVSSRNALQNASQSSAPPTLTDDQLTRACVTIYQEFDSNNDLKDSLEAFEERFNPKQVPDAVQKMLSHMIENKPVAAPSCGRLLANLIKRGTITKEHFIDALKFLVDISEDLIIDCPKLWVFLADATNPLIAEDCLQISELQTIFPGSPLLNHVSNKPVSRNSGASEDKDSILKKSLLECLNEETSDDVVKWIDENFENSRNSPKLVHKLTTTICQIVYDEWRKNGSEKVDDSPVIEELMKKYQKFFKLYIENKGELEMQCLMAVHEFIDKADYPQGLLMKLFEFFYDYKLISYDSYIQWKNTDVSRDRHRIGVALKSLNSFFEFIEEEQTGEDCE